MSEFIKVPLWVNVVAILFFSWPAYAGPMLKAKVEGIEVTVYSEDCQLKKIVSNLPKRATWTEKGKTFEGCAGAVPPLGILTFYFLEDRSVAVMPMDLFAQVTSL